MKLLVMMVLSSFFFFWCHQPQQPQGKAEQVIRR